MCEMIQPVWRFWSCPHPGLRNPEQGAGKKRFEGAGIDHLQGIFTQGIFPPGSFREKSCSVTIFVVLLASDLGKSRGEQSCHPVPDDKNRGYVMI